ncbi:MAG: dethiobiotin synthase [Candidatus Margulisiibacteriota bacterium]
MKSLFVCGTDTGVGKTIVTGLLAKTLLSKGYSVITQKWVQTGSKGFPKDIAAHLTLMGKKRRDVKDIIDLVCPYRFAFASSPHLAAKLEGKKVDVKKLKNAYKKLCGMFDFVIIEGVGGALVPLNEKTLLLDLVKELKIPVLLVVGNKLGAINHTLLTAEAIKKRGLKIAGIVFNRARKGAISSIQKDNIKIVSQFINTAFLIDLPRFANI